MPDIDYDDLMHIFDDLEDIDEDLDEDEFVSDKKEIVVRESNNYKNSFHINYPEPWQHIIVHCPTEEDYYEMCNRIGISANTRLRYRLYDVASKQSNDIFSVLEKDASE